MVYQRPLRPDELMHFGIKGMKWGVRKKRENKNRFFSTGRRKYRRGELMDANDKNDSSVTRAVKKNYNEMSDREFKNKYYVSKNRYRRRVNRYGDPYKHRVNSKSYKALKTVNKNPIMKWSADVAKKKYFGKKKRR